MMDVFWDAVSAFRFLRPAFLGLLLPIGLLWWAIRHQLVKPDQPTRGMAPHLARALTVGAGKDRRFVPIDGVAICLILLSLAAAGPSWTRVPNPLLAKTAPMVVVLEVSRSMEAPDLPPNRLERAKFKILDLVEARAGARTGLIAYGGTAHQVAPLTEDPNVFRVMLEALSPAVMPTPGENATDALKLAKTALQSSQTPGAILFVLDALDANDAAAFTADAQTGDAPVIFLVAAPKGAATGALAQIPGATVVPLSADDSDIKAIERATASAYRAALLEDERLEWEDRGWVLGWLAMPLLLIWFRRGWTMRWAVVALLLGGTVAPSSARADVLDWFFTPDQRGMIAMRDKNYSDAAKRFQHPMWRGYALLKSGDYEEAADLYARIDTPEAAFAEGLARMRNRQYRPAIAAYERALTLRPDYAEAEWNLQVSRAVLEYVESAREAGDTGEETGVGADDVVFDNEANRGAETDTDFSEQEDTPPPMQTAEQWMRSVDTDMGDFLRARFVQENATRDQP
ncbi:Tetratricopeptide repeat protein [Shimia sp. SK013]|uniref:VWA domain-containing protein n=1 Tax=Shimia sp. SK013 TaxID=1389006 RepID=UPI0006CD43A7|nr:VWA domain-containing protein [Shimia sp. SK013]KPA21556.1 Tetratricopeptide repeat protein [Shimia sp. SK013]